MSTPLVGSKVIYVSDSGKEYEAVVAQIPENPGHACTPDLTLGLEFRDDRGKLVRDALAGCHRRRSFFPQSRAE